MPFVPGYPVPEQLWVSESDACGNCGELFSLRTPKVNCPNCGQLLCPNCIGDSCAIVDGGPTVSICSMCYDMIQDAVNRERIAPIVEEKRNDACKDIEAEHTEKDAEPNLTVEEKRDDKEDKKEDTDSTLSFVKEIEQLRNENMHAKELLKSKDELLEKERLHVSELMTHLNGERERTAQLIKEKKEAEHISEAVVLSLRGKITELQQQLENKTTENAALQNSLSQLHARNGEEIASLKQKLDECLRSDCTVAGTMANVELEGAEQSRTEDLDENITKRSSDLNALHCDLSSLLFCRESEKSGFFCNMCSVIRPIRTPLRNDRALSFCGSPPQKESFFDWGYDVIGASHCVASILQYASHEAAIRWNLFESDEELEQWHHFVAAVEMNYEPNPYHNATHAADVLQTLCVLVETCDLLTHLSRTEKLAAVFAAIIHDVRHPGRTQGFLRGALDPFYVLFAGDGVLEHVHIYTALQLLIAPHRNFMSLWSRDVVLEFFDIVVKMVLATDMSKHFSLMDSHKKAACNGGIDVTNRDGRVSALLFLLHAADISNQTKGVQIGLGWSGILQEAKNQHEEEISKGYPASMLPPFEGTALYQGQIDFIHIFVFPVFDLMKCLFPSLIDKPIELLKDIHAYYCNKMGRDIAFPQSLKGNKPVAEVESSDNDTVPSAQQLKEAAQKMKSTAEALKKRKIELEQREIRIDEREKALFSREMATENMLLTMKSGFPTEEPLNDTYRHTDPPVRHTSRGVSAVSAHGTEVETRRGAGYAPRHALAAGLETVSNHIKRALDYL